LSLQNQSDVQPVVPFKNVIKREKRSAILNQVATTSLRAVFETL